MNIGIRKRVVLPVGAALLVLGVCRVQRAGHPRAAHPRDPVPRSAGDGDEAVYGGNR